MPVFDFSGASDKKTGVQSECTYTTFQSNEKETSPEKPIMILDNSSRQWKHHSCGIFTNPIKRTSFEFKEDDGVFSADIISIDSRFVSLLKWLGENHINVRLSGENKENGYAVYKIRETAFGGGTKLSAEDGFLQFMIERLLASSAPAEIAEDEDEEETGDEMKLTSIQSITDFMTCAGRTLPDNIRLWARRNLAVARSHEVSPEERRHAQRALSIMMNVQWKSNYFEAIDPQEARRILDEELYGMESVKQRIIETIIQINRTHTLPAYGLLLVGPAGTGKTACLSEFLDEANVRTCVTAPTNKAVKVIREVVGHKADTATIYSLLGIALMTDGEVKNIARPYGDKDLSDYDCVVIDEAGMLNKSVMEYIRSTAEANPHIAWIGIGDQCQLPPVNEVESEIWQEENQVHLTKVERTDNQILTISTHVRRLIETGQGINKLVIAEDYDEQGGVLVPKGGIFSALEQDSAAFLSGEAKALAWRNATVDNMNRRIRRNIRMFR